MAESSAPGPRPTPLPSPPLADVQAEVATRLPNSSPVVHDQVAQAVWQARRFGVVEDIERWAAQGLTRIQIAQRLRQEKRLGTLNQFGARDLVSGVHDFVGVPPDDQRQARAAWQQQYRRAQQQAAMTEQGLAQPPLTPEQQTLETQMLADLESPVAPTEAPAAPPSPLPPVPSVSPPTEAEPLPPPDFPGEEPPPLWTPGAGVPPRAGPAPPPAYVTPGPSDVIPGAPRLQGRLPRDLDSLTTDLRVFFRDVYVGGRRHPSGPRMLARAAQALRQRTMDALRQYDASPEPQVQGLLPMLRDHVRRIDDAMERLVMLPPQRQRPAPPEEGEEPAAAAEALEAAPSVPEVPQPVDIPAPAPPAVAPEPPAPPTPAIPVPTPLAEPTPAAPAPPVVSPTEAVFGPPVAPARPSTRVPSDPREEFASLVGESAPQLWKLLVSFQREGRSRSEARGALQGHALTSDTPEAHTRIVDIVYNLLGALERGEEVPRVPEVIPPAPPTPVPPVQPTPKPVPEATIANAGTPYKTQQNATFALTHKKGISADTHEVVERAGYGWFIVPKGSAAAPAPVEAPFPGIPEQPVPPAPVWKQGDRIRLADGRTGTVEYTGTTTAITPFGERLYDNPYVYVRLDSGETTSVSPQDLTPSAPAAPPSPVEAVSMPPAAAPPPTGAEVGTAAETPAQMRKHNTYKHYNTVLKRHGLLWTRKSIEQRIALSEGRPEDAVLLNARLRQWLEDHPGDDDIRPPGLPRRSLSLCHHPPQRNLRRRLWRSLQCRLKRRLPLAGASSRQTRCGVWPSIC